MYKWDAENRWKKSRIDKKQWVEFQKKTGEDKRNRSEMSGG